jgi:hypothetical protein
LSSPLAPVSANGFRPQLGDALRATPQRFAGASRLSGVGLPRPRFPQVRVVEEPRIVDSGWRGILGARSARMYECSASAERYVRAMRGARRVVCSRSRASLAALQRRLRWPHHTRTLML